MNKTKALRIIEGIIDSFDDSSSNGEEIDWALDNIGSSRTELKEALSFLSWLEDEDRMGK